MPAVRLRRSPPAAMRRCSRPFLTVEFCDAPLELGGAQGLIVTSRNALRALAAHRELDQALKLPLFAVGDATARAARELGFARVTAGPGTGVALAELISSELNPDRGPLVHLAGETLAFDLKSALERQGGSPCASPCSTGRSRRARFPLKS